MIVTLQRMIASKLELAYDILVPNRVRITAAQRWQGQTIKSAAIYARVSSDKQREENTIASQTAAPVTFAREQQFDVPQEWVFEDDGYSGAELIRPGLERVRETSNTAICRLN
jgi:hypothetical protein